MDGANTAQGIVRVDVTPKADATVPPEAENDTALLRNGGSTTIAPLNNDFDPSGGILVLQSVKTPPDSGVTVTVVDHSLLQITAASTVPANLTVESFSAPTAGESGKQVAVSWTVRNTGTGSTQASYWTDAVYASRDAIVGEAPKDDGIVEPGMVVTVEMFGDEETFLLGSREIADGSDSIDVYSEQSPLGAGINGHKVGETVTYEAPNGKSIEVTIISAKPYSA